MNVVEKISRRRNLCKGFLLVFVFFIFLVMFSIVAYSSTSYQSRGDVVIVLGAAVWDSKPSPVFEERILHAVNLYQSGKVHSLIFTGGIGTGDTLSESEVAYEYATSMGVPSEDIFVEKKSRTTFENLFESKKIVDERGFQMIILVSDPLHMRRAILIAEDLGMDAYPSPTPSSKYQSLQTQLGFLLRETYFLVTYLLRRLF